MSPASLRLGAAVALVSLGGLIASAQSPRVPAAGPSRVDFTQQIRPLLSDRCFRCHGPDPGKRKAKLRLDIREGAFKQIENGWFIVKPFAPGRSEVVRRTSSRDPDEMMPPPESRLTLSDTEQALIARWVAEGADFKPHWSLVPVTAVQPPGMAPRSSHPIDAFVRARLDRQRMAPAPPASREVLIRRLAFNLTGLPPTLDEIDAFLADRSPEAYARVVDRYLASPAYGERMAVDWLDLARYADTYGYQADVERDMSPYRDWVIRAFNANLPYREFLTWQLAGDLLPSPTRDQRVATAFNRLHRQTNEGGSIEEEFRAEYVVDRVNTFGTAMLGLTVECARCHDHKFDPITQRDYYSLFAFFNSIDESGLYSHFTGATPSPSLLLWPDETARDHQVLLEQIAAAESERRRLAGLARPAFQSWLPGARIAPATPISRLAFDQVSGDTTPDAVLPVPAQLKDGPALERDGASTTALRFSGDNAVVHPGVRAFGRTDRFSVSLRLKPTVAQDRAVVLHQSRAWTDAGSRGFELTLDHGRPFFGLIHFWPGNAVAIRSRTPLPLGAWSRLVITYDGSSRAAGIRLFLNGAPLASDVVRDRLFKDITYDKARGDNVTEQPPFTVGARFRDSGFRHGLIDDLQIFDVELTEAEVLAMEHRVAPPAALFRHFLARQDEPSRAVQRQLDALRRSENTLVATVPEIMVMEEMRTARPAHVLRRGSYDAPGPVVARDTPAALPPLPPNAPRNRLGLAQWLTARQHPLTARVAVNRIWRMHFGRGLVATQEDFGSQGRLPTHPELLDWLADQFMASGWDVKALHRLIVSSAIFQQSSRVSAEALANDPDNLLLSRGPKVRLSAESIRDSALAASGLLNRALGGPSVKPYQPAGLWEQSGTGKTYTQDTGAKLYRRSLYTFWRRTSPPPSMLTFDAMSREVCTAKRDTTVTPLQSLVLLNDPQFVEAARALAQRVLTTYVRDRVMRNREAFRALIGRTPDDQEAAILARLFDEERTLFEARLDDAERMLAIGESARDMTLPAADFAAMTSVVSAIMNFDEFVVVR